MNNVLEKGVFFAATELFGITFKERNDLPVYQEDVRVFEVFDVEETQKQQIFHYFEVLDVEETQNQQIFHYFEVLDVEETQNQ